MSSHEQKKEQEQEEEGEKEKEGEEEEEEHEEKEEEREYYRPYQCVDNRMAQVVVRDAMLGARLYQQPLQPRVVRRADGREEVMQRLMR